MKRIIDIIVVVGFSSILISTNAYVTNNNNNGNSVVTTIKKNNNIMDWLPKNAFLPKTNLIQIQEQLIHTVWNLQLDMETTMTKGVSTTTATTPLDPNQEFIGWKTKNTANRNMDQNVVKKDTATIKSSHLLLQRSSFDQTLPRLPIRNLQFMLGNADSVLKAHESSSSETSVPSNHHNSSGGGPVGYSTTSSSTSRTMNAKKKNHHPMVLPMPGYNGPHPLLSSGILPLNIQNCGEYVTLHKGIQSLPLSTTSSDATLLQPQWEVIWKEQSPTGTIVCGIQLQHSICRNDMAMIPAGMMYISFPIWDGTQLLEYQKKKIQYDMTTTLYSQERDNEIEKMTKSNNIFNKMMHYKNAFAAAENYSLQPHKTFKNVPTTLLDLIAIDNNNNNSESNTKEVLPLLYIVPKGMVRIIPTETMKQLTQTTPCGKQQQVMMNPNLLWSSSSTSNNNNNILHGTAKISSIPSVQQSPPPPPLRTLTMEERTTTTEGTTTISSSSNTQVPPLMDDVVSSTNTDTDASFM